MMHKGESSVPAAAGDGVTRKVLARGGGLMAVEFSFRQGSIGAVHNHPHEQIGYVVKGRFVLEMEGRRGVIAAGDSYYVPSGVPHGVEALEDGVLLDVFTPQREDLI